MSKNTYDYNFFLEIKNKNEYKLEDSLKEKIDNIIKTIANNYGISYYDKNKNKKHNNNNNNNKNDNIILENDSKWRMGKTVIKKTINNDVDKYKYEINSLLNKLSPKNFDTISSKILVYYKKDLSKEDIHILIINFIDSIFNKAVMQPIYCPYYVKFLNLLDNEYNILSLINEKCNDYKKILNKSPENTELNDYDKFCQDNIDKVFKCGYSQFIGELFNNKMIEDDIIKENLDLFVENLKESVSLTDEILENILICMSKLISTTSQKLKKQNYKYDDIYNRINEIYNSYNKNKKIKFKLLDMCEYIGSIK